jgi:hypothetical protein
MGCPGTEEGRMPNSGEAVTAAEQWQIKRVFGLKREQARTNAEAWQLTAVELGGGCSGKTMSDIGSGTGRGRFDRPCVLLIRKRLDELTREGVIPEAPAEVPGEIDQPGSELAIARKRIRELEAQLAARTAELDGARARIDEIEMKWRTTLGKMLGEMLKVFPDPVPPWRRAPRTQVPAHDPCEFGELFHAGMGAPPVPGSAAPSESGRGAPG